MLPTKPFLKLFGSTWLRAKTWGPAFCFFGGFIWDLVTLGRSIQALDLYILLGYWVGSAILMWWIAWQLKKTSENKSPQQQKSEFLIWLFESSPYFLLQFFFGGLFSALAIFYFKSAGGPIAFLMVFGLAILLVLNEFLENHYNRFTLTWTLFGICGMLFLNFALPHLFKSIHPIWFFLSTILAIISTWALRNLCPGTPGKLWPTMLAGFLLMALFLVKAIPPVPLVLKGIAIGRDLEKSGGSYSIKIEKPQFWAPFRHTEKIVRRTGEPIYCVSSVFMPSGLDLRLYHRWSHWNVRLKLWETMSHTGFDVRGGRRQGFRGYSYKKSLPEGKWMVAVESEDGRELGSTQFKVILNDTTKKFEWRTINLP